MDALKLRERDALTVINNGGREQVLTYEQKQAQINAVIKTSYDQLLAAMRSASMASGLGGGGSGSTAFNRSPNQGYSASRFTPTRSRFGPKGILAEDGAIVGPRKPTLVIAGEGDTPELVMPLDKSKGIGNATLGGDRIEFNMNGAVS